MESNIEQNDNQSIENIDLSESNLITIVNSDLFSPTGKTPQKGHGFTSLRELQDNNQGISRSVVVNKVSDILSMEDVKKYNMAVSVFLDNLNMLRTNRASDEVVKLQIQQHKNSMAIFGGDDDTPSPNGNFGISKCFFDRKKYFSHKKAINEVDKEESCDSDSKKSNADEDNIIQNNSLDPIEVKTQIKKIAGFHESDRLTIERKKQSMAELTPKNKALMLTPKNIVTPKNIADTVATKKVSFLKIISGKFYYRNNSFRTNITKKRDY